jgi:CheY-like chemotaxis protein|nr:response regulator [uncultured Methanoregula sp.]
MPPIPRILIVEDDEIIANLITTMLERKGYAVIGKSGSGEIAIRMAAELEPDLVIMDINLNGKLDGVTAARYIFQLFHAPVIFLTAMYDESLLERAKGAQPLGYILKPFTDKELGSNVELALYNHAFRKKFLDAFPIGDPKKIVGALEAILILDPKGMIVYFNPYSARILDLPEEQILMRHWRDVLMLINDQTNEELKDPVTEVVKQMLVVINEFNTALVTRTNKNRKVSVIVRPIKDDHNDLLGILMHIKEKTLDQIKMARKF